MVQILEDRALKAPRTTTNLKLTPFQQDLRETVAAFHSVNHELHPDLRET